MNNRAKLQKVFKEALPQSQNVDVEKMEYGDVGWDSLAHMVLCSCIESGFGVMLEIEQIALISSFDKAIEILESHAIRF